MTEMKVAVITAGGSGMGAGAARKLAAELVAKHKRRVASPQEARAALFLRAA